MWGNCLFQLAATIGYAKKHNQNFIFPLWSGSKYLTLDNSYFVNNKLIKTTSKYKEPSFLYSEIPYLENCDLHGYFQSWKYWDHCRDYIKEQLMPTEPEDYFIFRNMCSIHVRRGDYLKLSKFHPPQQMDYYNRAIEAVNCEKYIVFSDDIKWCKKNFKGDKFIVTEDGDFITDFKMQIACTHHIIANSSFSWWAAWLGEDEESKTIAPKNWFGPKLTKTHSTEDLIPKNWIQL